MREAKYTRAVSLGSNCAVAQELERFGLRDGAYPFDWMISLLPDVLRLMETSFDGFLADTSTLSVHPLYPEAIRDAASGLDFYHDFDARQPIANQLPDIRAKYGRRISRLLQNTEKTLYIRYIANDAEHTWLEEHASELLRMLQTQNSASGLLLISNVSHIAAVQGGQYELDGVPVYRVDRPSHNVAFFARSNRALSRMLRTLDYPLGLRARNFARYCRTTLLRKWVQRIKLLTRRAIVSMIGEDALRRIRSMARN